MSYWIGLTFFKIMSFSNLGMEDGSLELFTGASYKHRKDVLLAHTVKGERASTDSLERVEKGKEGGAATG